MANDKPDKQKEIDNLDYKIQKNDELIKNFKKFKISQVKIDRLEAKNVKYKAEKIKWDKVK